MKRGVRLLPAVVFFAVLLWLIFAAPEKVSAQGPAPNIDDQVTRISKELYCPVCSGIPLDVCDTQACVQWRALIREKLVAGESEEQIRQYFITQYGDRVLGAPPPEGFNLSAYILPALVLVLGALVLGWTARSWLKRPETLTPSLTEPRVSPETAERIARELKARE